MGDAKNLMVETGHQLHVVLISCPPPGHALPCSQFARKLANHGVAVSVVSSDRHVEELKEDEINCSHPNLRLVGLQDGSRCSSTTFWEMMTREPEWETKFGECLETVISKMRDAASGGAVWGPPCCVIADMFTLGWSQDIAMKLDLECHAFYPSPANVLCFIVQLKRLMKEGRVPVTPSNQTEIITDLPGLPELRPLDIPRSFFYDHPPSAYEFTVRHFIRIASSSVILVNTFEELEEVALHGLRTQVVGTEFVKARSIVTVGPLCYSKETESVVAEVSKNSYAEIDESGENELNPCHKWLNTQASESVLYVAFGSARSNLSTQQLHELAKGLEESGQPFLWALRPPGVHVSASSEASLYAVADLLPPGFLDKVKNRALVYPGWAPQQDILKHPAVGGFLTHCGWNSTLESIVSGVSMLVWPLGAEQRITGRFLVGIAKLAFELHNGDGTEREAAEVASLVKKLFKDKDGEDMRNRSKEMQKFAIRAVTDTSKNLEMNNYIEELQGLARQ